MPKFREAAELYRQRLHMDGKLTMDTEMSRTKMGRAGALAPPLPSSRRQWFLLFRRSRRRLR